MEDLEVAFQLIVDVQDGSDVTATVAVVRGGPNRDEVRVLEPVLEAVHDKLMGASHEVQVVEVVELSRHLGAEEPAGTTGRNSPGVDVLGVGPHEIAEGTLVRHLHAAVNEADLVEGLDLGRQTTVDAEDLALNDSTDTKVIEDLGAVLPGVDVAIFTHGLFVEAVDAGDTASLVVTTEERDAIRVLELEAEKQLERFDRVVATIDEVTHEDVAGVGNLATLLKQLKKIVELAVDITADSDGSAHRLNIALLDQDLLDLLTEDAEVTLG